MRSLSMGACDLGLGISSWSPCPSNPSADCAGSSGGAVALAERDDCKFGRKGLLEHIVYIAKKQVLALVGWVELCWNVVSRALQFAPVAA